MPPSIEFVYIYFCKNLYMQLMTILTLSYMFVYENMSENTHFRDKKAWYRLNINFGEPLETGFVWDKVKKEGQKGLISFKCKFGGILENRKHLTKTGFVFWVFIFISNRNRLNWHFSTNTTARRQTRMRLRTNLRVWERG